eukprot:CAMPEP_0119298232 /NCGR_PEP_ID=MMETSP1333-20130426/438_1 /TAXON_ID=418940 /ORGANISM="Scyphosphaera apsteinii, Strain RCC1455" /LENGTH=238 /DNA_ID=CAMNT_0007299279 /DNA_START=35 /DNA_END=751 /DNA_ORIENTATION=-
MISTLAFSSTAFTTPVTMLPTNSRAVNVQMVATVKDEVKSEFCFGLPGAIAPAGEFDPANLLEGTSKEEVYRWREAELTHGRVGMLASLGFLVQESFHPLFTADGGPAIEQIPKLPPALWFGMSLAIGICETLRIQKGWANPYEAPSKIQTLKPDYYPGDLGFDPLGLKPEDPAEFRIMQEKELSHGRLAMLAAAGFMAQEAVSGKTWSQQDSIFENLVLGPYFYQEATEVARDAMSL